MTILAVVTTVLAGVFSEASIGTRFNMPGIGTIFAVATMGAFILYAVNRKKG